MPIQNLHRIRDTRHINGAKGEKGWYEEISIQCTDRFRDFGAGGRVEPAHQSCSPGRLVELEETMKI